ncbi:MAG: hypothetical protein LKJ86_04875 [Oscillibacter sp.]|jgi:hypothetical protein|nr:hypothetical protein [Oscillibacter sp.]
MLEQVRQLYQDYLIRCAKLERERQPGDGLLGMGSSPDKDPCHDAFSESLAQLLSEDAQSASSGEAFRILEYMFQAPLGHRDEQLAYWMLLAVHGLTMNLIGCLDSRDAAKLLAHYREDYPRFERLPVQKKVLAALKIRI